MPLSVHLGSGGPGAVDRAGGMPSTAWRGGPRRCRSWSIWHRKACDETRVGQPVATSHWTCAAPLCRRPDRCANRDDQAGRIPSCSIPIPGRICHPQDPVRALDLQGPSLQGSIYTHCVYCAPRVCPAMPSARISLQRGQVLCRSARGRGKVMRSSTCEQVDRQGKWGEV